MTGEATPRGATRPAGPGERFRSSGADLPPGRPLRLADRRVLLVEENVGVATLLSGALHDEGATVDVVRSADAAAAQAQRRTPDAVVIHLPVPRDAAVLLARRLRRHATLEGVPLVILAADERVDAETGEAAAILRVRPFAPLALADDVARLVLERDR